MSYSSEHTMGYIDVVKLYMDDVFLSIPDVDKYANVHKKKWIDCDNIHVYRSEDGNPMAIDCYMFPFQMNLPQNLPGSCWFESNNGLDKAHVKYQVESEVLGCKHFKANQVFHIKHSPLEKPSNDTSGSASLKFTGGNFLRRISISVTARLNKPEYSTNETIGLILKFADLVKSKKKVESISVRVMQYLEVTLKWERLSSVVYSHSSFREDTDTTSEEGRPNSHHLLNGKCVLSRELTITDNEILESEFTFFVPLSQAQEIVIPSTQGQHIRSWHCLEVQISIAGMGKNSLTLPIRCLYPKDNEEWSSWQPPEWTYRSKLIKTPHVCSVPESVLASEAFAGFPGFQAF
ncbi:uncharacterized protein LOC135488372 isoform X2 [Lineus longissimus]|uniref:uncharacterized protein LOC135488372 isoform X2 n=1 Tax=Lineus longissimus TaxID=88925 RepID=UPI002B4D5E60